MAGAVEAVESELWAAECWWWWSVEVEASVEVEGEEWEGWGPLAEEALPLLGLQMAQSGSVHD